MTATKVMFTINSVLFRTSLFLAVVFSMMNYCNGNISTDLRYIHMCNKTSPISLRTMNEVLVNKKLSKKDHNSNFKCFLHCLFGKYGWMDEIGGFELHTIRQVLQESDIELASLEYILYTCTAVKSVDKCERAFLFTECFWVRSEEKTNEDEEKYFYQLDSK